MSRFLVKGLQNLESYTPGHQPQNHDFIKLNTNENPYPPCPSVEKKVSEKVNSLHLYCDNSTKELTKTFAKYKNISEKNILFANGSDEILAFSFLAFCEKETGVCFPEISYGFYEVFSGLFQVPFEKIPLNDDLSIDPTTYFQKGKTIIIANPNAPTGLCLTLDEIETILQNNLDHVVIIDEAYVDFGGNSAEILTKTYDNLLITGTFSKSRNLAGARLGYALGHEDLISDLNKIKYSFNPYNVNTLTQTLGVASIQEEEYFNNCTEKIVNTREYFKKSLEKVGFTVLNSKANFLFLRHQNHSGEKMMQYLLEHHILVRHFLNPKINDFLRISIGTEEDMEKVLKTMKEMVK